MVTWEFPDAVKDLALPTLRGAPFVGADPSTPSLPALCHTAMRGESGRGGGQEA